MFSGCRTCSGADCGRRRETPVAAHPVFPNRADRVHTPRSYVSVNYSRWTRVEYFLIGCYVLTCTSCAFTVSPGRSIPYTPVRRSSWRTCSIARRTNCVGQRSPRAAADPGRHAYFARWAATWWPGAATGCGQARPPTPAGRFPPRRHSARPNMDYPSFALHGRIPSGRSSEGIVPTLCVRCHPPSEIRS